MRQPDSCAVVGWCFLSGQRSGGHDAAPSYEVSWDWRDSIAPSGDRVLLYLIAGRRCASGTDVVTRVIEPPTLWPAPDSPDWFCGHAIHEGCSLPVYNMALIAFGLVGHSAAGSRMIVAQSPGGPFLFGVDSVESLIATRDLDQLPVLPKTAGEFSGHNYQYRDEPLSYLSGGWMWHTRPFSALLAETDIDVCTKI